MTTPSTLWSHSSGSITGCASGGGFEVDLLEARPGILTFRVYGHGARQTFREESGGHRWQRVPPTEKRGRVQTSTITVAVLEEPEPKQLTIPAKDIEVTITKGSGPGGQHRNVTESVVVMTHRPTKITVRCASERSQYRNRELALEWLRAKVWDHTHARSQAAVAADRKAQIGSGMRGDKRRTIRVKDGDVHDHWTGQRWRYTDYSRGEW